MDKKWLDNHKNKFLIKLNAKLKKYRIRVKFVDNG